MSKFDLDKMSGLIGALEPDYVAEQERLRLDLFDTTRALEERVDWRGDAWRYEFLDEKRKRAEGFDPSRQAVERALALMERPGVYDLGIRLQEIGGQDWPDHLGFYPLWVLHQFRTEKDFQRVVAEEPGMTADIGRAWLGLVKSRTPNLSLLTGGTRRMCSIEQYNSLGPFRKAGLTQISPLSGGYDKHRVGEHRVAILKMGLCR